jgi:hypothetical protein
MGYRFDVPFAYEREIVGVPRLGVVVEDVLLLVVAFSYIYKTIVEVVLHPIVAPTEHTYCTA